MAGLGPAIHALAARKDVDARDNPHTRQLKLGELVMRGLDPRIHLLREKVLTKIDGLPGQARQ
jgi:hypothetical protein